jgi:hydroxylamine reductase (hybrid-cluster protein)
VALTLGCGKFRLMGLRNKMGQLPGFEDIPRLMDVG